MKLYDELLFRGFIKDVSDEQKAKKMLNEEKINFYCGFDPTAKSLQMGNFVQIIRMMLLQKYGHKPIVLVGGATGLIGDPKQTGERKLQTLEQSLKNAENIKKQLSRFIDLKKGIIVNNYDWISKIDVISFLRDYGKHFNINYMLAKDTIATRLETGISYTEFSYMIIQSIDFLKLYQNYNCKLQFGGSDQWGNITSGLELIRKVEKESDAIGMSSPLLTKADNTKFGKSESGALYLDKEMTTPYEIYQYLINTRDEDVIKYLKNLTLLEPSKIIELEKELEKHPEKRLAQKTLCKEVITLIHKEEEYLKALNITEALFNGDITNLSLDEIKQAFKNVPTSQTEELKNIVDILVECNILKSKREARELINNKAITINSKLITNEKTIISKKDALFDKYLVVRKGKKNYFLIEIN